MTGNVFQRLAYWRSRHLTLLHSRSRFFNRTLIFSLLFIYNSADAAQVVETLVCTNNPTLNCRDILNVSCIETTHCPTNFDRFNDSTVVSYHIRSSTQIQPSVIIEIKDGDYKRLRNTGRVHYSRRGYIIGYRGCVSNPSQVCYIFHNDLPEPFGDWTHNLTVNPMGSTLLPFGERCTFFGCFVYCNIASCERVRKIFLEENVTIVATCPDLGHSIENGNVSYTRDPTEQGRYVENTTLTVSCDEGYRSSGDITCQNDGSWSSANLPYCTNITCPNLGHGIENGVMSYTGDPTDQGRYVENTIVTVSCDEGYRGGGDITCQHDGTWSSASVPSCTIVDCGTAPVLLNGDTLPFSTSYNSTVTYRCNSPYVFSDTSSEYHTCLLSGHWSQDPITCLATCPDLGHSIENGNVSYTRDPTEQGRYVENTTLTVSCDDDYRGGGDGTCQNGGNWSPLSLPSCRSVAVAESRLSQQQLLITIFILLPLAWAAV